MSRSTQSIESQITSYVSRLSLEKQKAVLTLLQKFVEGSEDEYRAEFERKWAEGIPLEEARKHTLDTVNKLFNGKGSRKK